MDKKLIIGFFGSIAAILIFAIIIFSPSGQKSEVQPSVNAKVELDESTFDWGEIGINDGNVEKEFSIVNNGPEALSLFNVKTSCTCTTAQLILDGEASPEFGMHDKSPYTMEVPSGKTAKLKVIYDPAFHGPSGVGPITRQVSVETNSMDNPELTFMLNAMVRN